LDSAATRAQSQNELAATVELNSAEWLRLQGRLPWVRLAQSEDVVWIFSGDTWPQNSVALARFTSANAHSRVGEILEPHLAQKVACNWIVGPTSEPQDLSRHLRTHGFSCRIHCAGMACDLGALSAGAMPPDGVDINLVELPPALTPLSTERRIKRHQGRCAMARFIPQQLWHFCATQDGMAVGETTLFSGTQVAGLYNVEVIKNFQRKGIGSALVSAALAHARKLGHTCAVLSANGMGAGVYERQGFREVCKMSFWRYGKMRQLRSLL
jgi:GNAT superfamily N-acetyltransferase